MLSLPSLKKTFLRILNRVARHLPHSFQLLGVPTGLAEFGDFANRIVYAPYATGTLHFATSPKRSSSRIRLSSEPRLLKGGGVMSLNGGSANRNGAVYTSNGELVVSRDGVYEFAASRLLAQYPTLLPHLAEVEGSIAQLSTPDFSYFHWMYDTLPKVHLLNKTGHKSVKLYLNISNRLQLHTLELLGVSSDRIVNAAVHRFVTAHELLVPHYVGVMGRSRLLDETRTMNKLELTVGNVSGYVGVAAWISEFLRNSFLEEEARSSRGSRIYISRRDAPHARGVRNEEAFLELIDRYGFETLQLSDKTFVEQVDIFNSAEAVIAPHGAGLTNLTFCRPGTTVLELISPRLVSDLYAVLSVVVGLRYHYMVGTMEQPWMDAHSNKDFEIDPSELEDLLRVAGVSPR